MTWSRQILRSSKRHLSKLFKRSGIEAGGVGRRWDGASMITHGPNSMLAARGSVQARAAARALNDGFEALAAPLLPLAARALVRDGEAFLRIHVTGSGEIRVKPIPADQVDPSLSRDLGGGARIVAGIEFNSDDEVTAYHILPEAPGTPFVTYGTAVRVPARDILHVFDPLFAGQVRGLSWLAPVLLKLRDRDEASDALLMQLKTAALVTGFVRDETGDFANFEGRQDGNALNVSLEPGAMRILQPGADVRFSQPGQGLAQTADFLCAQDREIAAGSGITYESLTGDMRQVNYSSARVALLEFRRRAEMLQRHLIEAQLLRPLWSRWIELRALAGELPTDAATLNDFKAVRFVPPGWQWVDPKNDVHSDIAAIEAGLKSRAEVVAARGRDIDTLDEEIARDNVEVAA